MFTHFRKKALEEVLDKNFYGKKFKKISDEAFYVQNRITWQREKERGALSNWKNGMENIWFATNSKTYTFHAEDVMIRRKVIAPYKVDGKPKDWEDIT